VDTLSVKLKIYCPSPSPSLYESLTSWEREAVDSSGWLQRLTSSMQPPKGSEEALETTLSHKHVRQE
jgi:hypothetical protein